MQIESYVFFILFVFGVLSLDYCGPNTMSTPCGNPCQKICGQLKPRYCSNICKVNGCVCKPNYIRRDENGPCIPEHWCKMVAEKWAWDDLRNHDDDDDDS